MNLPRSSSAARVVRGVWRDVNRLLDATRQYGFRAAAKQAASAAYWRYHPVQRKFVQKLHQEWAFDEAFRC